MIVVDHIGFVEVTGEDNRLRAPGIVMGDLKRLALESGVHVLAVSHVRKKKLGDKPNSVRGLEDLFGTGEVGQLADNVAVLRRVFAAPHSGKNNGGNKNLNAGLRSTAVDLLKVRDDSGYEGTVKLGFNPDSLRFEPH
jgi:replicative DNA helicase